MKYNPVEHYFSQQTARWHVLPIRHMECMIGSALPPSAYRYIRWYQNHRSTPQANAWLRGGYRAYDVDLAAGLILFERMSIRGQQRPPFTLVRE